MAARAILSDTVGFISDLPTMLVSAFRATLEEVIVGRLILHVRDISHADTAGAERGRRQGPRRTRHRPATIRPADRGLEQDRSARPRARVGVMNAARRVPGRSARPVLVSAVTGEGLHELLDRIEERLAAERTHARADRRSGRRCRACIGCTRTRKCSNAAIESDGSVYRWRCASLPERAERCIERFPNARGSPELLAARRRKSLS